MTLELVRPSGMPYYTPGYAADYGLDHTTAPTIVGGGSWDDDADSTYVSFNDDGASGPSVVTVAFPPVPGLVEDSTYDPMVRLELYLTEPDGLVPVQITMRHLNGTPFGQVMFLKEFVPVGSPITTPTTYTSAIGYSPYEYALIRSEGFLLTVGPGTNGIAAPQEIFRIHELGVWFDVEAAPAASAPWLRQYPRSPLRHWPPERSYQRSNRRAGGYL